MVRRVDVDALRMATDTQFVSLFGRRGVTHATGVSFHLQALVIHDTLDATAHLILSGKSAP